MTSALPAADKLKILLVDDQEAKLLSYQVILSDLGETLLAARSGAEALELLLKNDVAVVLIDVSMPGLDGFQLAMMIREHPRFQKVAIIFVSAIHLSESDILRGYEMGAVDYVPVPIIPELLRAKVNTFLDLHRKTRQLEKLNAELEARVAQRTEALEAASRRQELLAREVDHRARNALALVQAIVSLTQARDAESFATAVHGRIRAMARAHQLLSSSRWDGADLYKIVQEELEPYCEGDRVSFDGPAVLLRPSAAQMFALAVHELATNAVKYGALSNGEGRVDLRWGFEGDVMRFVWRETGGPAAAAPDKRGFGMTVIEASMSAQLQGKVDIDWRPEGLVCITTLPRNVLVASSPNGALRTGDADERPPANGAKGVLAGRRALLVEDEALVSMELARMLEGMGLEVIGPHHTLAQGLQAPLDHADVAVLDVNLGGYEVSPLSNALVERGIPVIFVTGYERDALSNARDAAAVLQKPVELEALRDALASALGASVRERA